MNLSFDFTLRRGALFLQVIAHLQAPIVGVFGPSGAGKSSLLLTLAGLLRPLAGHITLDETVLYDQRTRVCLPPEHRRVGLVFQDARLFPHLSVADNLRYGQRASSASAPGTGAASAFDEVVALLELAPFLARAPRQLSGGEAQRVALGRALLASPRLLLLDEPFAAVDVAHRATILPYLRRVAHAFAIPMVVVSHDLGDLLRLTDHLLLLRSARVMGCGHVLALLRTGHLAAVSDLSGLLNVLHLRVACQYPDRGLTALTLDASDTESTLVSLVVPHQPAWPPGTAVTATLRPEDIALATAPVTGISIQNQWAGQLLALRDDGGQTLAIVDVGQPLMVSLTREAVLRLALRPGQRVFCLFKARTVEVAASGADAVR